MLVSLLKSWRGIEIREIERTARSGSKITRFLEIQPLIASRRVSLSRSGKHTSLCVEHCKKITANNTHRYDDIADTLYDAVKLGLMDQSISFHTTNNTSEVDALVTDLAQHFNHLNRLRKARLCS